MEAIANDDDQEAGVEQSFFEEATELNNIVKRVVDSDGKDAQQLYDRYKSILYKYQEQSQLLDAYLEDIVVPLASLLRKQAVLQQEQGLQRVLSTCRLLNVLVVVRGHKTVVRFFPHEAADLERVLDILERVKGQQPKDSEEGIAMWEAQTMLLLWLSILILIPFDLATVDSAAAGGTDGSLPYTPLVGRILALCKDYLHQPGGVREMSALLLGRLLTRPDMGPCLGEFLDWVPGALGAVEPLRAPFLLPGVMQALCAAFKLGQRDRLLPFAARAWALSQRLASRPPPGCDLARNSLARKLGVKLVTRVGLTFLPPRLAPWRYVRGGASLDVTLGAASPTPSAAAAAPPPSPSPHGGCHADGGDDDDGGGGDDASDQIELAAEIEEVVEVLLGALRDSDTVVRWSGAKGVGRLTGCLPRELGDEVVEGLVALFGPTEGDTSWHGGCLALAELARRGLLLPHRLPALVPLVRSALHWEQRRGPHSVGAHVRDAAAYVCWAFARAYDPQLLEGSVTQLAASLLTIACYDREVNCRRAAAAAFQEAVGRLGNFPHGIPLLTIADYFSVGITQQAYLRVAPAVASLGPEYRLPLATHLVQVKSRHWEKAMRQLAARGAAALAGAGCCGAYLGGPALDELLPACTHEVLEVRHGAVLMVAELLPALAAAAAAATSPASTSTSPSAASAASAAPCCFWPLSPERAAAVAGLVPAIDRARLYRGKGGEVMREAVGRLVEGCAAVGLPLSGQQHAKVLEALDENLRHPQQYIQAGAVAAVRAYAGAYLCGDATAAASFRTRYLDSYLTRLHDPNVAVRRGYGMALGSLPAQLLAPIRDEALDALVDGCVAEEDPEQRDVDSRVACTRALGLLVRTVYGSTEGGAPGPGPEAVEALRGKVLPCLTSSLDDYTTDNRGDVGSWVREAAMEGLAACMALAPTCYTAAAAAAASSGRACNGASEEEAGRGGVGGEEGRGGGEGLSDGQRKELTELAGRAVGVLLRQSVERIARLRDAALRHLAALLSDPALAPFVPAAPRVAAAAAAAASAADAGGAAASLEALHVIVVRLLDEPSYTEPLLEGLVASVGGVDNSLAKAAAAALMDAVAAAPPGPGGGGGGGGGLVGAVAGRLLDVWARHAKSPRLATPLLRTALLLVTKAPAQVAELTLPRPPPPQAAARPAAAGDAAAAPAPDSGSCGAAGSPASAPAAAAPCSRFLDHLVEAVRGETRGCGDVGRLLDAASLLCWLAAHSGPGSSSGSSSGSGSGSGGGHCRRSALQGLLVLLCSRYPKVRRHTAEQLYLQLLALDAPAPPPPPPPPPPSHARQDQDQGHEAASAATAGGGVPLEAVAEAACEVLLATGWDADLEAARAGRDELAGLLGVEPPRMRAPAGGAGGAARGAAARDENASYQALLDDFARGY